MNTTIDRLKAKHDYSNDNCYIVFYHNAKPTETREIKVEWFDLNYGEKVLWLLIRERANDRNEKPKYRNIKFENVDRTVKIVHQNSKEVFLSEKKEKVQNGFS